MAVLAQDTLASVVRILGEFALPQDKVDPSEFRQHAEGWANHIAIATPPPGAPPEAPAGAATGSTAGRRDWEGLRRFVRSYCQSSTRHAQTAVADLRHTLWLFIRNLNQAFSADNEADVAIRARLERLEELAQGAAASDLRREVLATVGGLSEILEGRRKRHHEQMQVLGERVRSLGSELETVRRDSETDPLTQLINRKGFDDYLARTLEITGAFGQEATLVLIDVDHFKSINDRHGHTVGDETLRLVANAIVRVFLRKNDFCARYGGDEMAVVLRETSAEQAAALCERVLLGVRRLEIPGKDGPVKTTVSIGIGGWRVGDNAKSWIDRADRGLYAAKQAGRNGAATGV